MAPNADRFDLAPDTFFDSAQLHLLATGTLTHMQTLTEPDAQLDPRRFRPNILIETTPDQTGFVEDAWLGGRLLIGDVEIVDLWPTLRCVMTTLPQEDLVKDVRILKTAVRHHNNHVGVFASVGKQGVVQVGDPVFLVS
ncbi:MAG: MOSC domain-containing protein [Chloroflexota bacterium]